jgi:uncharacterized protein (TIGR02594 family)
MSTWLPIDVAAEYLGRKEVIGPKSDPAILAMLQLDNKWPTDDATPWCSAFVSWCAYHAGHERSTSLRARSWIDVGYEEWTSGNGFALDLSGFRAGDVLIFSRGKWTPGPDVIKAPGHVAFYTGKWAPVRNYTAVWALGGNQGDKVSIKPYSTNSLLAVRRLKRNSSAGFKPDMA